MCPFASFFFPQYFSCPFCRSFVFVFLPFSFIFSTLSRKWRRTLFMLLLRHLFLRYSGHLVKFSQIVEEVWTMSEQVVKSKDVRRQTKETPRSRWPLFYKLCKKCYRKSCKYMRNNSTRLKGKKSFNLTISKFRAQRTGDMWQTKVAKPWREKRPCTLHAGMASEEFANFNYTKGRPTGKLRWYEHSRDHLDYRWWDSIQRFSPQNTGRAKTAITLRLQKCEYRHALGARTFYTSPLRKCTET